MGIVDQLWSGTGAPALSGYMSVTITQYPLGDRSTPLAVLALVALDSEQGTNQAPGDGPVTQDAHGDRERRSGHIEVPMSLACDDRDTWLIDGELWTTQRQTGRDVGPNAAFQGWLITRAIGRITHHSRVRNDKILPR